MKEYERAFVNYEIIITIKIKTFLFECVLIWGVSSALVSNIFKLHLKFVFFWFNRVSVCCFCLFLSFKAIEILNNYSLKFLIIFASQYVGMPTALKPTCSRSERQISYRLLWHKRNLLYFERFWWNFIIKWKNFHYYVFRGYNNISFKYLL